MTGSPHALPADRRFDAARSVADTVLYEGYLLYPYRASAVKNRFRWQFGVVVPPGFAAGDPSERASIGTQVLVRPSSGPITVDARLRFLHPRRSRDGAEDAVEREVGLLWSPAAGAGRSVTAFCFGDDNDEHHRPDEIVGELEITVVDDEGAGSCVALALTVRNRTVPSTPPATRPAALWSSMVGTHVLLAVNGGEFLSAIDPPPGFTVEAGRCVSDGLFAVLAGNDGGSDVMLCVPMILADHPEVAPESQTAMFDATEIDEILALRIVTLTDTEKAEARTTDPRAATMIDHCEQMDPDAWRRLHGTFRPVAPPAPESPASPAPWWDPSVDAAFDPFRSTINIGASVIGPGSSVRLRPARTADAGDMFLENLIATVRGVFTDVDGGRMLGVTIDDDPGADFFAENGRYYFFGVDEVEVLT